MMEHLILNSSTKRTSLNLIRIGDLSFFEGPLLVLFEDAKNGHLYLFDWVDRNDIFNRWLVYRISSKSLNNFINLKCTHLELFNSNPDKKIYFTDIDNSNKNSGFNLSELNEIPINYYPNNENLFEINDSINLEGIKNVIIKSISRKKQDNEYTFFGINEKLIINRNIIKRKINRINNNNNNYEYSLNFVNKYININKKHKLTRTNRLEFSNYNNTLNLTIHKRNKEYA